MSTLQQSTRIQHLDIIRGVALLGILIMNIQSFAMPSSVYFNPASWGDFSGESVMIWAISHLIADSKFMSIFSILFGAGICLFADNAAKKGSSVVGMHFRRNGWLLLFGLIHAHLIWFGDILYSYALCSMWVVFLRNASVKTLWIVALVLLSLCSLYNLFTAWVFDYIPAEDIAEIASMWAPTNAQLQAEISAYTGTFAEQMQQRSKEAYFLQTMVFFSYFIFRGSALMLIGMALYKSGTLSGKHSTSFYWKLSIVGIAIGYALTSIGINNNLLANFSLEYSMFKGTQWNYWGSVATALGYIALINLAIAYKWLPAIQTRLAAVGQMAFTNYIMHSIVCTFIFYGWGLGLFANVDRIWQFAIVFTIWIFQLWLSAFWLQKYRFGPLEWCWRCLTYWKRQPFLR